jgi:hypothetical protein
MSTLVRENAGRETAGKQLPPVVAARAPDTNGCVAQPLRSQRTRDNGEQSDKGQDLAAKSTSARLNMADAARTQ